MVARKSTEKLDSFVAQVRNGETNGVTPDHVARVIEKLRHKQDKQSLKMAQAETPAQRARIAARMTILDDQLARARWVLSRLDTPDDPG